MTLPCFWTFSAIYLLISERALLKLEPSISMLSSLLMDSRSKLYSYIKKSGIIFRLWHIESILQTHRHLVHLCTVYNHRPELSEAYIFHIVNMFLAKDGMYLAQVTSNSKYGPPKHMPLVIGAGSLFKKGFVYLILIDLR